MRVGFDLDGVLCNIDISTLRLIDSLNGEAKATVEEWYYRTRRPELNPYMFTSSKDVIFVVTSRPKRLQNITYQWFNRFYPQLTLGVYFASHETEKINGVNDWLKTKMEIKAKVINNLNLDVYFDDDDRYNWLLRKLCTNTKIIVYGGRID